METQEFIDCVEELSIKFNREFDHCDLATLNFKPDKKSWSIAQIMAHLIKINESYFPLFTQLQEGKYSLPVTGKIGFLVKFFGKALLKSVQPETKKKSRTFPGWQPSEETFSEEILIEFNAVQEALKNHIENSEVLLHQQAIISSPVNKFIVYRLETAFQILLAHEERHFQQAKRVLEIQQSHL